MSIEKLAFVFGGVVASVCVGALLGNIGTTAPRQTVLDTWVAASAAPVLPSEPVFKVGQDLKNAFATAVVAWSPPEGGAGTPAERQAVQELKACMNAKLRLVTVHNGKVVRLPHRNRSPEYLIRSCEQQAIFWPETTPEMRQAVARRQALPPFVAVGPEG